jgi:hypothetical protein
MTAAFEAEDFKDDSQRQQWQAALNKWRFPYWDFGLKSTDPSYNDGRFGLPKLFTLPQVAILRANGNFEPFDNPLTGFINPMKTKEGETAEFGNKKYMLGYEIPDDPVKGGPSLPVRDPPRCQCIY